MYVSVCEGTKKYGENGKVFSLGELCVKLENDCESVLYFLRYLLCVRQAIA